MKTKKIDLVKAGIDDLDTILQMQNMLLLSYILSIKIQKPVQPRRNTRISCSASTNLKLHITL